jgi:molecular chaperone GrpE
MDDQTATTPEGQSQDLAALLEAARKEVQDTQDKYLRALAESENMRKRMERLCDERVWQEKKRVLSHLLEVADQVEQALKYASAEDAIGAGVRITLQHLHKVLAQEGVQVVPSVGQAFDPNMHEAVEMIEGDGEPNQVAAEFRKGYTLNGRLLRAARVQVHKAS